MHFIKYPSLTNTYKKNFLLSVQIDNNERALDSWVVTEKIHGANFAIHYDPKKDEMRVASRNQFVGSDFFNNNEYVDSHKERLLHLFRTVIEDHDYMSLKVAGEKQTTMTQVILYGELFGKGINKGVEYPKGRHFLIFDIFTNVKYIKKDETYSQFMDWNNVQHYSDLSGIKTVPVLAVGTLDDCLKFDPNVLSVAGKLVDPEFVSSDDNWAEGVVLRPNETFYIRNERAILKNKIEKFKEKVSKPRDRKPEPDTVFVEYPDLPNYITDARLQNVLSKEGNIHDLNFQYVVQMFIIDMVNDFCKDNECEFEKDDLKRVKKSLVKHSDTTKLVRQAFGYV